MIQHRPASTMAGVHVVWMTSSQRPWAQATATGVPPLTPAHCVPEAWYPLKKRNVILTAIKFLAPGWNVFGGDIAKEIKSHPPTPANKYFSPGGTTVKNVPANAGGPGDSVRSLGQEDPLREEMATHSSILAWIIPWTEEPGGLHIMSSQRIGHDWQSMHAFPQNKAAFSAHPSLWSDNCGQYTNFLLSTTLQNKWWFC